MAQNKIQLTDRELEILKLIHEGFTDVIISEKLGISINTVRTHRQNLRGKFSANNTPAMLRMATQLKFIMI